MKNPIIELSEVCQKNYGASILTRVVSTTCIDHCPRVHVEIELPNGNIYRDFGDNKKIAKQKAAKKALKELNSIIYNVKKAKITIDWVDIKGKKHKKKFDEKSIEEAETILGLMLTIYN